jgi:hypothetical protein
MSPEPKRMNDLFAEMKPTLLELPSDSLQKPRVSRERALQLTTVLRQEFAPLVPRLAEELSPAKAKKRKTDFDARAYTHWLSAYVELLHLGRYLERDDPAAAERFPAVSAERGVSAPQPQPAAPAASSQDGGGPAPV